MKLAASSAEGRLHGHAVEIPARSAQFQVVTIAETNLEMLNTPEFTLPGRRRRPTGRQDLGFDSTRVAHMGEKFQGFFLPQFCAPRQSRLGIYDDEMTFADRLCL